MENGERDPRAGLFIIAHSPFPVSAVEAMSEPLIRVEGIAKRFPGRDGAATTVFEDVHFSIEPGEFVCLIGHSGCGKTTILNILAGLEPASDGYVFIGGREIRGPSLDRAVIFQSHALMPWLTVTGNIGFAVTSRWPEWDRARVRSHCQKYVELVNLAGAEMKRPAELSGGMKQRVGIARALAIQPKMLLMDEPFSALDALTRGMLQEEVLRILAETRQTAFMITHDVDEAILLADKIVLMTNGPRARIAEIVVNPLPRSRTRYTIHKEPHYYAVRNHLVDFLVSRSRQLNEALPPGYDPKHPPLVTPGLSEAGGSVAQAAPRPPAGSRPIAVAASH